MTEQRREDLKMVRRMAFSAFDDLARMGKMLDGRPGFSPEIAIALSEALLNASFLLLEVSDREEQEK